MSDWKEDLSELTEGWTEHQFVGSVTLDHKDTGLPMYVLVAAGDTQDEMEKRLHQLTSHGLIRCKEPDCELAVSS